MLYQLVIILCATTAPCKSPQWHQVYAPQGQYGCAAQLEHVNGMFTKAEHKRFMAGCTVVKSSILLKDRPL